MSVEFELNAEIREDLGKGASRRLRRSGRIPAVVYGAGKPPVSITLRHDDLFHALENEAFYSHIITLSLGKKKEKVILKDLQRHPFKPVLLHADFLRVKSGEAFTTSVPVHFIHEEQCYGVKTEGGLLVHLVNDVEISCKPKDLPEYIEVDVANLKLGETIHLSDIEPPKGVEFVALSHGEQSHDIALVTITKKGGSAAADEAEAAEAADEGNQDAE